MNVMQFWFSLWITWLWLRLNSWWTPKLKASKASVLLDSYAYCNPNDRSGAKVATAAHQFGGEKKRSSHWAIDHFHDRRHQHGFQSNGRALTSAHRNFLNLFELCEMTWMYFEVKQGRYCISHSELPQISTRPCSIQAPSQKIEWESHTIAGPWKILVSLPIIAHWWS